MSGRYALIDDACRRVENLRELLETVDARLSEVDSSLKFHGAAAREKEFFKAELFALDAAYQALMGGMRAFITNS